MIRMLSEPIAMEEKNLRYWLFAWWLGDASGGLNDLVNTYASFDEAMEGAKKEHGYSCDSWNILDTHSMSIVYSVFHGIGPDGQEFA